MTEVLLLGWKLGLEDEKKYLSWTGPLLPEAELESEIAALSLGVF